MGRFAEYSCRRSLKSFRYDDDYEMLGSLLALHGDHSHKEVLMKTRKEAYFWSFLARTLGTKEAETEALNIARRLRS